MENADRNLKSDIHIPIMEGDTFKRVIDPAQNQIVYMANRNTDTPYLYPVLIISGSYLRNKRISNTWSWYVLNDDLTIGKKESGYGEFYPSPIDFNVRVKTVYEISKVNE